ncbi:MAG: TatD family hydrolase [Porphyromonas sp.]|nr:TatD family hydrolase [Porphyromonas sp.]
MRLIDTHAHLYSEEFEADIEAVLASAEAAGVIHTVMPGISSEEYPALVRLLHRFPGCVTGALGLHPAYVKENYRAELDFLEAQATAEPWVAIGEIGLDYYWSTEFKAEQRIALYEQLRLALRLDLPVIIHVRNAFEDLVDILNADEFATVRGVIHSFTGTEDDLARILPLERYMIAINGVATFKNAHLRDYIGRIPIERVLVETDAPYLAPVPHRGKRNEPAFVHYTAEHIAPLWGLTAEAFGEITTANAQRLFGL